MRVLPLIFPACAWLSACAAPATDFTTQRSFAMGTWVDVTFESTGSERRDADLLREIETLLRAYEIDYYAWADGELGDLNAHLAASEPFDASDGLLRLLLRAKQLSAASDGNFDPGVGGLVELWGFHDSLVPAADPGEERIAEWLETRPSIAQLRIDGHRVSSTNAHLKIDLGGIAKGEAVDRVLAALRDEGIASALVNAGGDLHAIGTRSGRSWRIGIQAPRAEGLLGYIELADGEAAFTSGDYERFFDEQGHRMHHLLDARTGYPAEHTQAVTVLAKDGVTADAAATAIFVAGPDKWRKIAADLGITTALRVDASGTIEMTDSMRARLVPAADGGAAARAEGS